MPQDLDLSHVDLNLLVLFEAVMRERHVARTGARLHLSPSAVSHGLARLRRLLNDPLFLKHPKGVVPTERATLLAGPIHEILERVRSVVASAEGFDAKQSTRRFTIGAPDAVLAARRSHRSRREMPSVLHEVLRELFAKRPHLLAPFLEERLSLPAAELVALDSELTDPRMKQLLPDALLACPSAVAPAHIVIVEVHLHVDEPKRRVWAQYATTAYARYGCPVVLVVVTPSPQVEAWATRTIEIGPGHRMTPDVIGPSALPRLDSAAVKRTPVLAMLSTLAHTDAPDCAEQALETLEALASWGEDADGRLADILEAALPAAVRIRMEELMRTGKYEYQSEFARKYFALGHDEGREKGLEEGLEKGLEEGLEKGLEEGRAAGEARALLLVLRSRDVHVPSEAAHRIEQERDGARLDVWIRRAATARTIEDVFGDE